MPEDGWVNIKAAEKAKRHCQQRQDSDQYPKTDTNPVHVLKDFVRSPNKHGSGYREQKVEVSQEPHGPVKIG